MGHKYLLTLAKEVIKKAGLACNTYYKYKRELRAEQGS